MVSSPIIWLLPNMTEKMIHNSLVNILLIIWIQCWEWQEQLYQIQKQVPVSGTPEKIIFSTNAKLFIAYMKGVPNLFTKYHNEPIETSQKKKNYDKPVRHYFVTSLHLSIMSRTILWKITSPLCNVVLVFLPWHGCGLYSYSLIAWQDRLNKSNPAIFFYFAFNWVFTCFAIFLKYDPDFNINCLYDIVKN